jgi:hypothetical protein
LTIENVVQSLGYTPSTDDFSLQPEYGLASVNMEDATKSGAWLFESESKARTAKGALSNAEGELWRGYTNVEREGDVVTANGGNYQIEEEMNDGSITRFSTPRI